MCSYIISVRKQVMTMWKFEIKKVFSRPKNKLAVLILLILLAVTSILTINRVEYTDENGSHSTGITAARKLREMKNQWAGDITEEKLAQAIAEYNKINSSEEARSENIQEQNKAFAKKQGFSDIIDRISVAFSPYREYDYFRAESVSQEEVGRFYEQRIDGLKEWFASGKEKYTEAEQAFMLRQYENLKTPFYYEYADGWKAILQSVSTYLLILALVIGFLVSGIFSDEFQMKADAVFFSSRYGRTRGTLAKIGAGLSIVTVFYVGFVLLYTVVILGVLGFDGWKCPIQLDMWRSVYNITFLQAYLFILAGGYVGTLLASLVAMLVSALTKSASAAITAPFILLCAMPFLSRIVSLPQIFAFFPDQLLEIYLDLKEAGLVEIGGRVTTVAAVIIPAYAAVCLVLGPLIYKVYKKRITLKAP